jgi:hypothetical protein
MSKLVLLVDSRWRWCVQRSPSSASLDHRLGAFGPDSVEPPDADPSIARTAVLPKSERVERGAVTDPAPARNVEPLGALEPSSVPGRAQYNHPSDMATDAVSTKVGAMDKVVARTPRGLAGGSGRETSRRGECGYGGERHERGRGRRRPPHETKLARAQRVRQVARIRR